MRGPTAHLLGRSNIFLQIAKFSRRPIPHYTTARAFDLTGGWLRWMGTSARLAMLCAAGFVCFNTGGLEAFHELAYDGDCPLAIPNSRNSSWGPSNIFDCKSL